MTPEDANFEHDLRAIWVRTDQLFFWLLPAQWLLAIGLAVWLTPYGWRGGEHYLHVHVQLAVVLGGVIVALPLLAIRARPGNASTRHVVAIAQMAWSALLIHITGGRVETHFHVFGSLAFLAFYRDWRVLVTGTLMVALDHGVRGAMTPESLYGIANPGWGRFFEHVGWVLFEVVVLVLGCHRGLAERRLLAQRGAALERVNEDIERRVEHRTTELRIANESLHNEMAARLRAETELRHAHKLEAVGRLAAGVAHEINTPVQYVNDSVYFLRDATSDLLRVVRDLEGVARGVATGAPEPEAAAQALAAAERADLDYVADRMPKALDRCLDGLGRVSKIVRSMKEFGHPDGGERSAIDLNAAIESTLEIARNEYKYVADVVTRFGALPPVLCFGGELNQVVLNLVINAAHAIGEVVRGTSGRGVITVGTFVDGFDVVIEVTDTGTGIPEDIRQHIFDPFFTTKEVGQGTGQGLPIVRSVVEKHGGRIDVATELGIGTTFSIRIPYAPGEEKAA